MGNKFTKKNDKLKKTIKERDEKIYRLEKQIVSLDIKEMLFFILTTRRDSRRYKFKEFLGSISNRLHYLESI